MDLIAQHQLDKASQIYYCVVKSVNDNQCTIVFNNKQYTVSYYGGKPKPNKTYAIFLPHNNMNESFVIGEVGDVATEDVLPVLKGGTGATTAAGARTNLGVPSKTSQLTNDSKYTTLLDVYPVGSIYMSVNSTSPATLFGGTWEQLENRFLLGAGSTYSAGSTGGNATMAHTHTMSHTHNLDSDGYAKIALYSNGGDVAYREKSGVATWTANFMVSGSGGSGSSVALSSIYGAELGGKTAGSSAANTGAASNTNNMPPYLTVYMWKRTN